MAFHPEPSPSFSTASTVADSGLSWRFRRPPPPVTFGSEADLRTATNISFKLIETIRKARKDSAIVVLNFRALQARRIDEMQEQLLKLSKSKLRLLQEIRGQTDSESDDDSHEHNSPEEVARALNGKIDELLHQYALALRDYETLSQEAVAELIPQNRGLLWPVTVSLTYIKKRFDRALNRQVNVDLPPAEQRGVEELEEELIEEDPAEEQRDEKHASRIRLSNLVHLNRQREEMLPSPNSMAEKKTGKIKKELRPKQKEPMTLNDLFKIKNAKNNFREVDKTAREARESHKASSERLWMGSFGGLALIVPMLVMVLHRSLRGSLIVSSVGTVLFAFALALAARSLRGMDVLAATAAYAAVLVVFVGTSLPPVS